MRSEVEEPALSEAEWDPHSAQDALCQTRKSPKNQCQAPIEPIKSRNKNKANYLSLKNKAAKSADQFPPNS
jgi:hypothetical protein